MLQVKRIGHATLTTPDLERQLDQLLGTRPSAGDARAEDIAGSTCRPSFAATATAAAA